MLFGFPLDVRRLLSLSAAFYCSRAVPSNDPMLQLQLRSAGSLHVAFRNLHESQSWGRAVIGHHLHKIWPSFTQTAVLWDIWMCIVRFRFLKQWVWVKVTKYCFKYHSFFWENYIRKLNVPCLSYLHRWIHVKNKHKNTIYANMI